MSETREGCGYLLPPVDESNAPFWEGTRQGELRMPRCADCGRFCFPPRPMCPDCQGTELSWQAVEGRGRIWSFVRPHPPLLPEFSGIAPYNVILVALDLDPRLRLLGNLVREAGDLPNAFPEEQIEIDAPVRVVYAPVSEHIHLPRWVPA